MRSIFSSVCGISLLSILFSAGGLSRDVRETTLPGDMFDLVGIPAPYNFYKMQELATGERLRVGGSGDFGYIPNPPEKYYRGKVANTDLSGIYFVDPKDGWVVGSEGSIFYTTDRGRTWSKQDSKVKSDLLAISCVSKVRCWVTGDNGMLLTTENGKDWKRIESGVKTSLTAVDFLNEKVGLVVGKNALILRTEDGGTSWQKQEILGGEQTCNGHPFASNGSHLFGVTIFDTETAWAAGSDGVARYSGKASTWEGICVEDAVWPVGIVSQNGKDVFAIGSNGKNVVSRDSGSTWKIYDATKSQ